MWVYDEDVGGQMLSNVINKDHENVKYLPGFVLPKNVIAITDIKKACEDSNVLIFALPHQYLAKTLETIKNHIDPPNTDCISLIKGCCCFYYLFKFIFPIQINTNNNLIRGKI